MVAISTSVGSVCADVVVVVGDAVVVDESADNAFVVVGASSVVVGASVLVDVVVVPGPDSVLSPPHAAPIRSSAAINAERRVRDP